MRERHRLIPKKERVLGDTQATFNATCIKMRRTPFGAEFSSSLGSPVIEFEARSPVGGSQESLDGTGEVNKQIAHEEKPEQTHRQEKGNIKKKEECQKYYLFVSLFVF